MSRERALQVLIYAAGISAAGLLWALLLFNSIYDDPLQQQTAVSLFLLFAAALGAWIGPEQRASEERDLGWLYAFLEWGLALLHLPLLFWAVLHGPLLVAPAAALIVLLGWATARFLSRLLPRSPSFRTVHALLLAVAGAVAMQGYLTRADHPPYCDELPSGRGSRAVFSFDDCMTQSTPEGLCTLRGAAIEHLSVAAGGRYLLGTAVHPRGSGVFRIDLAEAGPVEFLPFGGLAPRTLMPQDARRVYLVVTDGPYNRMFWVEADPFRIIQATALSPTNGEIAICQAVRQGTDRMLLLPRSGERALEVSVTGFSAGLREAEALDGGIGELGDGALDPVRRRLFLSWPLYPFLHVLDASTLQFHSRVAIGPGGSGMVADLHQDRLYVARYLWGDAVVLDTDTLQNRGSVSLGFSVHKLALSPDRQWLAGLGFATGWVDLTRLDSGQSGRSFRVGRLARGLTWSRETGKLYAASRCGVYELEPW